MLEDYNYAKYRKYKELYKSVYRDRDTDKGNSKISNNNSSTSTIKNNQQCSGGVRTNDDILGCKRLVYFFDNDAGNFVDSGRCVCVIPIEIEESQKMMTPNGKYCFTDIETYQNYLNGLSPEAKIYGEIIIEAKGIDRYDPKSAIKSGEIKEWLKLLNEPSFRSRTAAFIFDWDRTLTVTEGIPARFKTLEKLINYKRQTQNMSRDVTDKDIIEYYFGGIERVELLRELFRCLNKYSIAIYVLSANRGLEEHRDFFYEILDKIAGPGIIKKDHLIYKGSYTKYNYIEDILPDLCSGK